MQKMYFVYIIKSLKDGKNYVGQTNDIEKRLRQHNAGMVRSTKARRPFRLLYKELVETRNEAIKRENFTNHIKVLTILKS